MSSNHQLLLRQWAMLRMIPRYPRKITAREMMEKLTNEGFTITKRSVERDLQGISATFPLVSDEREKPYGWSWAKDAPSFDLPGLSQSEALVFKLAQQYLVKLMPTNMLTQLTPYFAAADKSLNDAFQGSKLSKWQEKIAVAFPGQPLVAPNIDSEILFQLESGLLEDRQIKLEYRSRQDKSASHFTVHPLGIVLRGQISYLVCTLFEYQDIRMLAIHRICNVEKLDKPSRRPEKFSLQEYATSSAFGFNDHGEIDLTLKFTQNAGQHLYETPINTSQSIEETTEGEILVRAKTADNAQLIWWILGFGEQVEVIAPISLRQKIIDISESVSKIYKSE